MEIRIEINRVLGQEIHIGKIKLKNKTIAVFNIEDKELLELKNVEILNEKHTEEDLYIHFGDFTKI